MTTKPVLGPPTVAHARAPEDARTAHASPSRAPFAPLMRAARGRAPSHDAAHTGDVGAPRGVAEPRTASEDDASAREHTGDAGARASDDDEAAPMHARADAREADADHALLDPLLRTRDLLAPASSLANANASVLAHETTTAGESRARTSIEDLLPALVRRVAWSGDGKKGAVRLELAAGALAGATVIIESDEGRVRVRLQGAPGTDAELVAWRERIGARLAARRIGVDAIDIE